MDKNTKQQLTKARKKLDALNEWITDNNGGVLTSDIIIELWHDATYKKTFFSVRISFLDDRFLRKEGSSVVYQESTYSNNKDYNIDKQIDDAMQFATNYLKNENNGD